MEGETTLALTTKRHFLRHGAHGSEGLNDEKAACPHCQIRSFPTHARIPITVVNIRDSAPLPAGFFFTDRMILTDGVQLAEDSFRSGCECDPDGDGCQYGTCSCLAEVAEDEDDNDRTRATKTMHAYVAAGPREGMLKDKILRSREPIYECNRLCACAASGKCPNRVVERGRAVPLQIFRTADRGWGVRSSYPIKEGQFVDCYLGEVLTSAQAAQRRAEAATRQTKDVYMFALDKFCSPDSLDDRLRGDPLEVDGEFVSGPTRFVNHSCDPNMRIFARVGDHADKHLHDLAFFAIRDIPRDEELTFDYIDGAFHHDDDDEDEDVRQREKFRRLKQRRTKCLCGSAKCRGYLW